MVFVKYNYFSSKVFEITFYQKIDMFLYIIFFRRWTKDFDKNNYNNLQSTSVSDCFYYIWTVFEI